MSPQSIEGLVDRQIRRWEAAVKAQKERPPQSPPPCVAFSRLPHAGGAELARRVADRIDYGFFGREILVEIERNQGVRQELLAGLDERVRTRIERFVLDAFRKNVFQESDFLRHLVQTIHAFGERGMAVLLGRGASFILPVERTLRVLVVASDDFRRARLARARGLSEARAREVLAQDDRDREEFLRLHFQSEPTDARHYDLAVNTGTVSMDAAESMVMTALRDRFPEALARTRSA